MRHAFEESLPPEHLEFMQETPFYHEDEYAIYVHAGLDEGKHPSESSPNWRCCGCATWTFTKTIVASRACLDTRQPRCCL